MLYFKCHSSAFLSLYTTIERTIIIVNEIEMGEERRDRETNRYRKRLLYFFSWVLPLLLSVFSLSHNCECLTPISPSIHFSILTNQPSLYISFYRNCYSSNKRGGKERCRACVFYLCVCSRNSLEIEK